MKVIHVGSGNQTKIKAAENILLSSKLFESAGVKGVDIDIEEFGHPKTIEETVRGARAVAAFRAVFWALAWRVACLRYLIQRQVF